MAATCHEHGILPVVTFHHFTHPRWLADAGTWEALHAPDRFARFCERVTAHMGDLIGMACTLNEPNVVATMGWRHGLFPPRVRDRTRRDVVNAAMVSAHRKAVEAIRSGPGDFPVGMTVSMTDFQLQPGGEEWIERLRRPNEDVFLEATGGDDFIGVQTYTRMRVGPDGALGPEDGVRTTQMGYEVWPESLGATIRRATEVTGGLPVYVTENGIGTDDDALRIEYVTRALAGVRECLDDGIDVRGYFYWSLLDNFEWVLGYGPTFGLVAVDRETFERTAKPSAGLLRRRGQGQRTLSRPAVPTGPEHPDRSPARRPQCYGCVTSSMAPMPSTADSPTIVGASSSTCGRSGTHRRRSISSSTRWSRWSRPSSRSASWPSSSAS